MSLFDCDMVHLINLLCNRLALLLKPGYFLLVVTNHLSFRFIEVYK